MLKCHQPIMAEVFISIKNILNVAAVLRTAAPLNKASLTINIRAVSVFTGKLIHLAAFVHNVHYVLNMFLKLSDAIPDSRAMCERNVCDSRCTEETGQTPGSGQLQRVCVGGGINLIHQFLICMFASFTYGWMSTFVCTLSPLAVVAAAVLIDGCFQLKEMLHHGSPDGSLDYPGNHTPNIDVWVKSGSTASKCVCASGFLWRIKLRCLASAWLQCVFGFVFNSVKQRRPCFSHWNEICLNVMRVNL